MRTLGSAQARWKRSADAAVSAENLERQRGELARCLAGRLLNPRGQRNSPTFAAVAVQSRSRYENAIVTLLDDFSVRLSLAARHLQVLDETMKSCDYEDAESLASEARWTRAYYEAILQCPIPMSPEWDQTRPPSERRSRSMEEFLAALEDTVIPHLHAALETAAA